MTQLDRLKIRIPEEPDDVILEDVLDSAKNIILTRRFPFQEWPTKTVVDSNGIEYDETYVEDRYLDLQLRISVALYNKLGAENEVSHSENGVVRHWSSEGVPIELLSEIVPFVGLPG